jgi:hypothetical protein
LIVPIAQVFVYASVYATPPDAGFASRFRPGASNLAMPARFTANRLSGTNILAEV